MPLVQQEPRQVDILKLITIEPRAQCGFGGRPEANHRLNHLEDLSTGGQFHLQSLLYKMVVKLFSLTLDIEAPVSGKIRGF